MSLLGGAREGGGLEGEGSAGLRAGSSPPRRAPASTANAREAIGHLCQVLADFGASPVRPETLRRAKFNEPSSAEPMWRLLHDLAVLVEVHGLRERGDPEVLRSLREETLSASGSLQGFVRRFLARHGFAVAPAEGGEGALGSRELLVALAWVCARFRLLDAWVVLQCQPGPGVDVCAPPFPPDTSAAPAVRSAVQQSHQAAGAAWQKLHARLPAALPDLVDFTHSVFGQTTCLLRDVRACQMALAEALHTIHAATQGAKLPGQGHIHPMDHLSMYEVHLLRHKSAYMAHLRYLESHQRILKELIKLQRRHHGVIWQWFASALGQSDARFAVGAVPEDQLDAARAVVQSQLLRLGPRIREVAAAARKNPLRENKGNQRMVVETRDAVEGLLAVPAAEPESTARRIAPPHTKRRWVFEPGSSRGATARTNAHQFTTQLTLARDGLRADGVALRREFEGLEARLLAHFPDLIPVEFGTS